MNLVGWGLKRIGEDWISRRGSVLKFLGESGGLLLLLPCDGLMGEDESGEETAGLCGDEKSRLKIGVGIVDSISSESCVYDAR